MIDRSLVEHVALLARLEIPSERLDELCSELGSIIEYVNQLSALEVSDVPPLTHAAQGTNVYRDDTPGMSLSVTDSLSNAPDREGDFYRVPRVIGDA